MKINFRFKAILFLILYPFFWIYYRIEKNKFPTVCSSAESLKKIKDSRKSLSRFGDGELNLIFGEKIGFQNNDNQLAKKLKETILSPSPNCYVAIPDIFNSLKRFTFEARCFWLYTLIKNWRRWRILFKKNYLYLDTQCSRFYMDVKDKRESHKIIKYWKSLWEGEDIIIVEGKYTKMGIGNDLFSNCKSIKRIVCPPKNAYLFYDVIKQSILKQDTKNLILIALGPTATVLANDLANHGYWAIDSGHLDIEYNWMMNQSKKKESIEGRLINEVSNNRYVNNKVDDSYFKQIVEDLSNHDA